jgi:hypothetical protein
MISVYSDSQVLDLDWIPKITFPTGHTVYHSFEEYAESPAVVKIAFTTHRLHVDHDINSPAYQGFEDKINKLSAISQYVFTFESELHNFHWNIWSKCHDPNVYWILPGTVNDSAMKDNIIYWGDWFKTTATVYKELPDKLAEINPYIDRPRYFDALLGSPKPHRDFIYNSVHKHNLQDKFIMPYGGQWDDNEFYAKDYFVWEPGVEVIGNQQAGTAGPVRYYGVYTGLSRVIPLQIFKDTAYSIVAETDHDNTLSFFSEKTAKPIIARRLFVAFTGYLFLHNLRELGFQTFDGIIDERYDKIKNDTLRYEAAFEQVKYICDQPQSEILERVRPIVEHNYNLLMTRDWTAYAADSINQLITGGL